MTAAKRMPRRYPPRKGEKASPGYRVRLLLTELVERGVRPFSHNAYRGEKERYRLDRTNDVTKRAIGLDGKCLALRNALGLQAYIRQRTLAADGPLDIAPLLAA